MVFASKQIVIPVTPPSKVAVMITGTGDIKHCYAIVNGIKLYAEVINEIEVKPGDTITFGVYGTSQSYYGEVKIDGIQVLKATNQITQTYSWTVPSGISSATIAMTYISKAGRRSGNITVTTA